MVNFFEKTWVKRTLSGIIYLYGALLIWLLWASFAYVTEYNSQKVVLLVFFFVNLLFGAMMFLSRKQVFTAILVMLLVPINLGILILNFGNWLYVLPPVILSISMFFIVKANSTLKTILGTIYLLMYVLGILAYIAFVTLFGQISLHGFDLENRKFENISPNEEYRYVWYEQDESSPNRRIEIYVESNTDDVNLGFVNFKNILISKRVYAGKYDVPVDIKWKGENMLVVNEREERVDIALGQNSDN